MCGFDSYLGHQNLSLSLTWLARNPLIVGNVTFDGDLRGQNISLCNVSPVDGLVWNEEAAGSNPAMETKLMEGYQGWALHCLENRWTAKAVGVRFYHPSSIKSF